MTALENVMVGAERPGNPLAADAASLEARARAALAFVGLEDRADELVAGFSYGHQRLIEIASALAGNPVLLLLDEPAAGLNASEKVALTALLRRMTAKGLTILHHRPRHDAGARRRRATSRCSISAAASPTATLRRCCANPTSIAAYLGEERGRGARAAPRRRVPGPTSPRSDEDGARNALLELRDIVVSYGEVRAVEGCRSRSRRARS